MDAMRYRAVALTCTDLMITATTEPATRQLVLLSHADTDLTTLRLASVALARTPIPAETRSQTGVQTEPEFRADAPRATTADTSPLSTVGTAISACALQTVSTADAMHAWIDSALTPNSIVIARVLGRADEVPGLATLAQRARELGMALIVLSGTGETDPEFDRLSNVATDLVRDINAYWLAGGIDNVTQSLRYASDRLWLTTLGYEAPRALPEHGIYLRGIAVEDALEAFCEARSASSRPAVGLLFYRAHWTSGNVAFIDALVDALEARGADVLPVFTHSLREVDDQDFPLALRLFERAGGVDLLINTTSFAIGDTTVDGPVRTTSASGMSGTSGIADSSDTRLGAPASPGSSVFERLGVPVLQAITSGMTRAQWAQSPRGLSPLDTAMNVALPEFDGRIIGVPISFKAPQRDANGAGHAAAKALPAHAETSYYEVMPDRIEQTAALAMRLAALRKKPAADKRIAFVFTNSSGKAAQIGNAVGLDAPASLMAILRAMQARGYRIEGLPDTSDALMHDLIDRGSYDQDLLTDAQMRHATRVQSADYARWIESLPELPRGRMVEQWGDAPGQAYVDAHGDLMIAGIAYGNAFVALQPPRGYGMNPDEIYHQPDLAPTHHYHAFYRWIRDTWQADAIVHVGKHGTLEWLPGKGIGLSDECFPDAFLADMPLFYPFIVNDPGEGSQAKRRGHAVIIDHLMPPMTSADTYGPLAELVQLVDEYYQVEALDPVKLPLLQRQIWDLIRKAKLDTDIELLHHHHHHHHGDDGEHDHHDHNHDHEHGHGHGHEHHQGHAQHEAHDHDHTHDHTHHHDADLPAMLTDMAGTDFAHLIEDLDGYLCELGAAQIRDGLHTLGNIPKADVLVDLLAALTRIPNLDAPSLPESVAHLFELEWTTLHADKGARLSAPAEALESLIDRPVVTHADAIDAVLTISRSLLFAWSAEGYALEAIDRAVTNTLGRAASPALRAVLSFVSATLVPNLVQTSDEIDHLLDALDGRYIPAGPSGAPTRGMAHVLPTGRNFYSVDPRAIPSMAASNIGEGLANEVLRRHLDESGHYPESIGISVWGTSAMRTHGDDIAEVLALLGVKPDWQPESRRVTGFSVIPLSELGRPRIDVTLRISGFFRDAFPHLIALVDDAIQRVARLDEPIESNFVRKHFLEEMQADLLAHKPVEMAEQRALYRIFGAKPGSYGAGILPLIQEQNWQTRDDFARAYIEWGGYAYTRGEYGTAAHDAFRSRLAGIEVALHNQDNREHDIFDSDDYLQFHGGMIAAIQGLTGHRPRHYFGDTHDPSNPRVRDLKQEALRVFRSRVVNPKWIASIRKHGYKGGLELNATVDYLFGYDATADILDDWMYEDLAQAYVLDADVRQFLDESNPWALRAITERLLEAAQRGMWEQPDPRTLEALRQQWLDGDAALEARSENGRGPDHDR
ncbi:MAG TPA: cobaltochelatase subunit CobN [Pararobbsia sp.]|nr:cobaltochelatase subunit CobN [Pararobbsia sp.]